MNVLSLFDGMSCGRIALERIGVKVTTYYASEIDKYAMKVAKLRWPDIVHIGNVLDVKVSQLPVIPDLLIGGSPCQGFSKAGKGLNFDDPRSKLFFEYLRILKECHEVNPNVKFLLENVEMDRWCEGVITEALGVQPLKINSALVSAQNRERLYWTNIGPRHTDMVGTYISDIPQPKDRGIVLKDIIEEGAVDCEKSYCIDANYAKGGGIGELLEQRPAPTGIRKLCNTNPSGNGMNGNVFDIEGKSPTLTTNKGEGAKVGRIAGISFQENGIRPFTKSGGGVQEIGTIAYEHGKAATVTTEHSPKILTHILVCGKDPAIKYEQSSRIHAPEGKSPCLLVGKGGVTDKVPKVAMSKIHYRKLTVTECERLQTVPDGYTEGVSNTQRHKMLGNGWTIDVIAHIFGYLEESQ